MTPTKIGQGLSCVEKSWGLFLLEPTSGAEQGAGTRLLFVDHTLRVDDLVIHGWDLRLP